MFLSSFAGFVVHLLALVALSVSWATEPIRRIWPEAFPAAAPRIRTESVRLSVEDAKPAAQRVAAYQIRVADRHDRRHPLPGLIFAV